MGLGRGQISGRWKAVFVMAAMVVLAVVIGVVVWWVNKSPPSPERYNLHSASLQLQRNAHSTLHIHNDLDIETALIQVGHGASDVTPSPCADVTDSNLCLRWENDRQLRLSWRREGSVSCVDVSWRALRCATQTLRDCVVLGGAHWYGGFQDWQQPWPLQTASRPMAPYVAGDSYARQYGGVMARYFLTSLGLGVHVAPRVPLYVSWNSGGDGLLCLEAKYRGHPYRAPLASMPELNYTVCQAGNVRLMHDYMSKTFFPRPLDIPDPLLFRSPIWSTWAMYKKDINQTQVLQFAADIKSYNFSHSQLELDDDWTPHYGDMDFNPTKFPDAKAMMAELQAQGFRVTIWLHPFFNIDSRAFLEGHASGHFLRQLNGTQPALVSWWRGQLAAILDVTSEDAVLWFLNKTRRLQVEYNISSFKFDAGEVSWLPHSFSAKQDLSSPDDYPRLWAQLAFRADPDTRHQEVRVGAGSQHLPIFVRMLDRDSVWTSDNGLRTLIPCALTFGLLGFPFVLPDMIGGNAYDNSSGLEARNYPEPELFIRWLQVNTFMPAMQFSVVPWVYENATIVNISRYFINLHEQYADVIRHLAEDATRTGAPIVRPLWWIAPLDQVALTLDSEYLLGNDLLAAPVLEPGATSRDVYLPAGTWRDQLRGGQLQGPRWLRGYRADLHQLPYFTRVSA